MANFGTWVVAKFTWVATVAVEEDRGELREGGAMEQIWVEEAAIAMEEEGGEQEEEPG